MKIFCDTNILMEYIQQRNEVQHVEQVLRYAEQEKHTLYISLGSFYTLTYLIEKYIKLEQLKKEERIDKLREILNGILDLFHFTFQTSDAIKDGVNDETFTDLEDSYQAHAAESEGCDVILTIDTNHFKEYKNNNGISVVSPLEFINNYIVNQK